ncbi:NAD(P)-binding protein [Lophiostoma macrostomum CBS 122681]|uniref:NAD(P)-binding protein n=1 Tax=Lophiostoma macrostomum CBS 122681 TaxID=1314788 RepID=A0A6A6SMF7_9PLEO|nr:NAD(P)-binding protein [Lophiostoma macrostomum CBS 122681]
MTTRLANKIAIITGSSSGIGRATALLFAQQGATIICSDIRPTPRPETSSSAPSPATLLPTTQELEKLGHPTLFVPTDITQPASVQNLIKTTVDKFGRLDILFNNAGISPEAADPRPVWDYPESYFDSTLAVNLKGVFLGTKYAALQMKSQSPGPSGDRGWIVNTASVLGLNGTPGTSGYVASKHGVMGLTKTAAWDCAEWRIHVNAVCPGYTATSMTAAFWDDGEVMARLRGLHPFRGLGTAEDIARAALFLASEDAGWVTGVGLPVDGGYSSL